MSAERRPPGQGDTRDYGTAHVTARLIKLVADILDALSAGLDADAVNTFLSNQLSYLVGVQAGTTPWDERLKPVTMFKSSAKK